MTKATQLTAADYAEAAIPKRARGLIAIPRRQPGDRYKIRPRLYRDPQMVDPDLRRIFTGLIEGRLPWPLYLWGDPAVGKTRAALCLCDAVDFGRIWTVSDVMDLMSDHRAPWEVFGDRCHLAVLDELGTHRQTGDFELDAARRFADWREDRPAVYISNHESKVIGAKYCVRVESRVACGTPKELKGPDLRVEFRKPRKAT